MATMNANVHGLTPGAGLPMPQGKPRAGDLIAFNTRLFRLHFREGVRRFFKQPLSFQFICFYAFCEYVRPQAIYGFIGGLPLASWAIYLTIAAWVFEGMKLRKWTIADSWLTFFTLIVIASCATAVVPSISFDALGGKYLSWILIFFMITVTVDNEERFFIFMFLWLLWSLKMSQHGTRSFVERGLSFAGYGVTCAPQFFHNSGECGIQMTIFFPISLYFYIGIRRALDKKRRWFMLMIPATAAITIMASSSRGAQLALLALLLWIVLRSRQRVKALLIAGVAAAALYSILPKEQLDRFREMGEDKTSLTRKTYWKHGIQITNQYPVLGIGFSNWRNYYKRYDGHGQLPHNIFVEASAELGYPGLIGFIGLIAATFIINRRTRRIAKSIGDPRNTFLHDMAHGLDGALIGYLVSGFFVTVLYYPFFWINLAMTVALHSCTRAKAVKMRRAVQPNGAGQGRPVRGRGMRGMLPPGIPGQAGSPLPRRI